MTSDMFCTNCEKYILLESDDESILPKQKNDK